MTALGRPSLLLQLSEVIVRARRYYQNISGADGFVIEGEVSKEVRETLRIELRPSRFTDFKNNASEH